MSPQGCRGRSRTGVMMWLTLAAAVVLSGRAGDVETLLTDAYGVYQAKAAIEQEANVASRTVTARLGFLNGAMQALDRPPPEGTAITKLEAELAQAEQRAQALRDELAMARLTDLAQRAARKAELAQEATKLRQQEQELTKPFNDRISAFVAKAEARNDAFIQALRPYCKTPGPTFPEAARTSVGATFHDAFAWYRWLDSKGAPLAYAHLRLRPRPALPPKPILLNDKYFVQGSSDNSAWVWVGNIQVVFIVEKAEWQGPDKPLAALSQFVDLDGLAGLKLEGLK